MGTILDRIGTYNLFNYLFPGILFVYICKVANIIDLFQKDLVIDFFIYYFIGMVISRIGSLFIEGLIKKVFKIEFAEYNNYLDAQKKDNKINLFVEINNMYRTIIAVPVTVGFTALIIQIKRYFKIEAWIIIVFILIMISLLFSLAYKKQSEYIVKRVIKNKDFHSNSDSP
ncbi:hypothetical protein E4N71_03020 [Treponema vincentii]|uniref:hypothetical protein n=1 Tax=Treponema vincentii TaxID=69710 RepID=UPI003D93CD6C